MTEMSFLSRVAGLTLREGRGEGLQQLTGAQSRDERSQVRGFRNLVGKPPDASLGRCDGHVHPGGDPGAHIRHAPFYPCDQDLVLKRKMKMSTICYTHHKKADCEYLDFRYE